MYIHSVLYRDSCLPKNIMIRKGATQESLGRGQRFVGAVEFRGLVIVVVTAAVLVVSVVASFLYNPCIIPR